MADPRRRGGSFVAVKTGGRRRATTALFGGVGVATNYTWREDQYEIDVTVSVPAGTRAGDVAFRATPRSVDLRLIGGGGGGGAEETVLLDGARDMRGRLCVDGTYWAISDGDGVGDAKPGERQVTVTIEKIISEPKDQFEVVEFDWGGVYPNDEEEVVEKKYDEPEELDVREYCRELGVDIDNINMSMVDKTMFSSGLNMTRNTLDELSKAGYVKEVTQQSDGAEYVTDDEGSAVPFSPLGDGVGEDEIREALYGGGVGKSTDASGSRKGGIKDQLPPLVDMPDPWQKSMPAEEARIEEETWTVAGDGKTSDEASGTNQKVPFGGTSKEKEKVGVAKEDKDTDSDQDAADPIDLLKVKRLKEILREQNLKVSGNKQELRDRLRAHVNSMLEKSSGNNASER